MERYVALFIALRFLMSKKMINVNQKIEHLAITLSILGCAVFAAEFILVINADKFDTSLSLFRFTTFFNLTASILMIFGFSIQIIQICICYIKNHTALSVNLKRTVCLILTVLVVISGVLIYKPFFKIGTEGSVLSAQSDIEFLKNSYNDKTAYEQLNYNDCQLIKVNSLLYILKHENDKFILTKKQADELQTANRSSLNIMLNIEYFETNMIVNSIKFIENGIELVGTSKDGKFRIEISNDNTLLNYNDNLEWLVFKNGILENHYSFKSNKFLEITITEQDNYSVVLAADFINGSKFNAVSNYVYSIDN